MHANLVIAMQQCSLKRFEGTSCDRSQLSFQIVNGRSLMKNDVAVANKRNYVSHKGIFISSMGASVRAD